MWCLRRMEKISWTGRVRKRPTDHKWRHKWRMHLACCVSKATCTYAHAHPHAPGYPHERTRTHAHIDQQVILIAFPRQQWFANAPHCYAICTLSLLLLFFTTIGREGKLRILYGITPVCGLNWVFYKKLSTHTVKSLYWVTVCIRNMFRPSCWE